MLPDFAKHLFRSHNLRSQIVKTASGVTRYNVSKKLMEKVQIPIPPLEVQCEIVRILDNFTKYKAELIAKLTTEREVRKKQYEYYRDCLLNFDNMNYKPKTAYLADVLKIKNGKDYKHLSNGDIPVYGSGGIMTYVNDYIYDKPSVLIPRKGSIDKLYYVEQPFWNVDTIFYTKINSDVVIPKFVYYCLQKEHLEELNISGGVPSLTQSVLSKIKMPIPSMEIQEKIVNVLENFETICDDLNIGLPKEIELRQKQYEYYRDKLLTF